MLHVLARREASEQARWIDWPLNAIDHQSFIKSLRQGPSVREGFERWKQGDHLASNLAFDPSLNDFVLETTVSRAGSAGAACGSIGYGVGIIAFGMGVAGGPLAPSAVAIGAVAIGASSASTALKAKAEYDRDSAHRGLALALNLDPEVVGRAWARTAWSARRAAVVAVSSV